MADYEEPARRLRGLSPQDRAEFRAQLLAEFHTAYPLLQDTNFAGDAIDFVIEKMAEGVPPEEVSLTMEVLMEARLLINDPDVQQTTSAFLYMLTSEIGTVYDRALAAGKDPVAALTAYNPQAYPPAVARSWIALAARFKGARGQT